MKRTLLIIALISIATCQVVNKSEACTCAQLLTLADCGRNSSCSWNTTKLVCEIPQSTGPVAVVKNYGKSLYCEGQAQTDCLKLDECAWIDNKCTFFTSCTPYEKANKDECQEISKRCITDGQICVEIDQCSTYLTSTSCYQSKTTFCVWDEPTKKCSDVTECGQLPITLTKDSECRQYLRKECTAKPGGGCVESGTNCEDQTSLEGCVTNKARSVKCYWNDEVPKCYEEKCEFARKGIKTHAECQLFSPKCTANEGGGCVDLKTCADGKISEGCKVDSAGKECYWSVTEKKCKDKVCVNAPNTLLTNSDCQKSFLTKCITSGAGCVDDTSCSSSTVQEQCAVNRFNNRQCTWNVTCKDKTCENAGPENVGHDQCSTYSKLCTGKANNATGCQNRTCENAPTTIISNPGCEEYLPNKNCITKKDGGCVTNKNCSDILIKEACVKDLNKKDCYWDSVAGNCLDKTCATLPTRLNSHPACNGEINTCTVSSSGTCVDLICENVVDKDNCIKDKDGADCIYYGSCFQKQCSAAPQSFITHAECYSYLPTCTLTNTKKGCIDIPLTCSALIKENCELKANGDKCGWTGSACVDIVCTTAPTKGDDEYTVNLCEAYKPKSNCVPNQTKKGCMELVAKCESRTIVEQCNVAGTATNGGKTCLWDTTNSKCYEKTCANATKEGNVSSVVVTGGEVTHNDCQAWLKDKDNNSLCVVGTANNVCAPLPTNCSGLGENSCLTNVLKVANSSPVEYLNCFWNATTQKCVDGNVCANIDKTSHVDCTTASNKKCTVSADESKCVDRQACNVYTKEPQCKKDKNDSPCTWDDVAKNCSDTVCLSTVEDSKSFITHDQCTTKSNQCTVTNLPCGLKKASCANYGNEKACLGGLLGDKKQCSWNSSTSSCEDVADANFVCANVKGANLTAQYCKSLNDTCSVNAAGTACIIAKDTCNLNTQTECKWSKNEGDCFYATTCKAVSTLKCSEISGTTDAECRTLKSSCIFGASGKCKPDCSLLTGTLTYDSCQNIDLECSVKNDGTGCYYIDKNCSLLTTNTCTKGKDGFCQKSGAACTLKTISNAANCGDVATATQGAAKITAKYCKEISTNLCTAKPDQSACDKIEANCGTYATTLLPLCYYSTAGLCINASGTCEAYQAGTTACAAIILGGATASTLNHNICQEFSKTCTVDDADATKCKDYTATPPTCAQFKGTFNFFNCFHFLSTCTVNSAGTACIDAQATCNLYDASDKCGYAVTDGPCVWDGAACKPKSCDAITTTDVTVPSIDTCSAKQQSCTVRTGGCMKRVACTIYTTQVQCVENLSGGKCIWNTNTTPGKCFDKTCTNADTTYNTHVKCQDVGNCTVKVGEDGTTLAGCINLGACSDYKVADQCKINASKKDCEWSLAETPNKCVDKTCTSADPAAHTDYDKCSTYITNGNCTLAAKKNEDGTYAEGGCMALALCSEYNTANQCKKSKNKDSDGNLLNCYWNDTTKKCGDASCLQADDTLTTHDACVAYGNTAGFKCTVDMDDKGCVPVPETCEGMSKGQCVDVDAKSNKCIWLEVSGAGSCATRTCENAVSPATASDCSNHLFNCTMIDTGNKCKTKTCEDYNFTEDAACAALFNNSKKCTTNGKFCVNRGTCAQAQSQKGCVTDTSTNACEWIVPTDTTKPAYCVTKTCNTAPKDFTTESQCLQYFTPKQGATCNTQQGGGCVQRSSCSAAKVQAACNTDSTGFICAWDADTSACRNQECKDISGTTHAACQNPTDKNFKGKCTAGKSGKCAAMQKCVLTTVEAACVQGTDGPCIWIPDYFNNDGTKGACFLYDSCRSLDWVKDQQCKLISDKCTTNGKQCIGITSCTKTNVDGGCVTGTDGECITTVSTLGSTNKVCTKYVSCNSALFTTHSDCQLANPKCTTNGTSSCIELAACSTYVKEACKKNKDDVQRNSNGITSTGKCSWDETSNACRDENCSDFKVNTTTHGGCSSQLMTCTTDGTNCITKDSCVKYSTNSACINSVGTEGLCQWVEGTGGAAGTCRVKTCEDITGGTTIAACSIISTCTTDGIKCITKGTCDKYTTKTGCNSRGTDGICAWTETTTGTTTTGKCSLMTNCAAGSKDQNACQQASNRCKWTSATATTASSCVDHTCESYNAAQGRCSYFPNWDSTKYNICRNVAGKCTAADPKTLLETECYNLSAYMYSWNSKTNACSQCGASVISPNNSTNGNETNNNGSTSTDSGYVLGVAVLLGYLMY